MGGGLSASSYLQRLPFGLLTLSQNHSAKRNLLAACRALDTRNFNGLHKKNIVSFRKSESLLD
jgi:hypothetical protein